MKKTKTPLPGELKRRKRLSVELKRRRRASFWFLSPSIAGVTLFFLAPFMVPVASVVLIWQVLFHQNGVINSFL